MAIYGQRTRLPQSSEVRGKEAALDSLTLLQKLDASPLGLWGLTLSTTGRLLRIGFSQSTEVI
jgi:hypothetical protein